MGVEVNGFIGLIILVFDIWAIIQTVNSAASTGTKVVWVLVILLLPVLGLIIWFFAGPRAVKP